ncbi:benzoate transporter [Rhodovibrio sodomensis]|uniref:Benzoate transporter n=1 Tax=Rhodovibrio sodomensis TaxID=1088 RepID=A0ABS1DCG5_9PROT|nr:putative sulfate/molybdate transporter [Rhodovibrio sodomensis]MBK1667085.1 benzoate transporter [Rhodovibrio sodomensis]
MSARRGAPFVVGVREVNGALGDLGTLLPLVLGAVSVAGLAPTPILLGFAVVYLATGLYYRLPVPVQPMKAVAAVVLTAGAGPAALATSGVLLGIVLLVLGLTGWIARLGRLVPQSVLAGLQLGLGLSLAGVGLDLMAPDLALGAGILLALLGLLWLAPRAPAILIVVALAIPLADLLGARQLDIAALDGGWLAVAPLPQWAEVERAASLLVVPQLSLTFMNAVVLTALVAGDYFGERAAHVTSARLAVSSGLANLVLTPFGALPMCHGAGGLAAHYRFGARSGAAPVMLGLALLALAVMPAAVGGAVLSAIPAAALGALLLLAAGELGCSRRLIDCRRSCWPVIAVTAAVTVWLDPFWGLLAGGCAEVGRAAVVRRLGAAERT